MNEKEIATFYFSLGEKKKRKKEKLEIEERRYEIKDGNENRENERHTERVRRDTEEIARLTDYFTTLIKIFITRTCLLGMQDASRCSNVNFSSTSSDHRIAATGYFLFDSTRTLHHFLEKKEKNYRNFLYKF